MTPSEPTGSGVRITSCNSNNGVGLADAMWLLTTGKIYLLKKGEALQQ